MSSSFLLMDGDNDNNDDDDDDDDKDDKADGVSEATVA